MLNTSKVIKAFKHYRNIFVGISDNEKQGLITNGHVLLSVDEDELWDIRSSLKIKELGKMYFFEGKAMKAFDMSFPASAYEILDNIKNIEKVSLEETHLQSDTDFIYLHGPNGYVCVDKFYMDMFASIETLEQEKGNSLAPMLVNGKHIICPVRQHEVNKFLK